MTPKCYNIANERHKNNQQMLPDYIEKLRLIDVKRLPSRGGQTRIVFQTSGGDMDAIFHQAAGGKGVIWLCGALGGFDGPSFGIFATVAEELVGDGLSSLRLNYRYPGDFGECVLDTLAGVEFLKRERITNIALVGHSFGGAVAIEAGTMSREVKAVIGVSSQTYGAQRAAELSPRSLLLIHGDRDRNLDVRCSHYIYQWAREPKELVIYKGCGHFLRECHEELHNLLRSWLVSRLGAEQEPHA